MSLDTRTVRQTAALARICIEDDQLEKMVAELNSIFSWIEQLNEVDTSETAPLASVTGHDLPRRQDAVTEGGDSAPVLANAPESVGSFFAVPKVVE